MPYGGHQSLTIARPLAESLHSLNMVAVDFTASSACLSFDVPQGLLFPGPERLHGGLSSQGQCPCQSTNFVFLAKVSGLGGGVGI